MAQSFSHIHMTSKVWTVKRTSAGMWTNQIKFTPFFQECQADIIFKYQMPTSLFFVFCSLHLYKNISLTLFHRLDGIFLYIWNDNFINKCKQFKSCHQFQSSNCLFFFRQLVHWIKKPVHNIGSMEKQFPPIGRNKS